MHATTKSVTSNMVLKDSLLQYCFQNARLSFCDLWNIGVCTGQNLILWLIRLPIFGENVINSM